MYLFIYHVSNAFTTSIFLQKSKKSFNFRDYFRTFIAKNVVDSKIERVQDAVQIPFLHYRMPCRICCYNLYDPVGQEIWETP